MKHLAMYVRRYPAHYVPPDWEVPEGYIPEGSIEDYDVAFLDEAPQVGQQFEYSGDCWTIAQVQTYQPLEQLREATECFYSVICTWDGAVPSRTHWENGVPPILVIHASSNGELVVEEEDEVCWELVMRKEWITPREGWQIQTLQHFEPTGERLSGDFDTVVVAWSLNAVDLQDSPEREAAA